MSSPKEKDREGKREKGRGREERVGGEGREGRGKKEKSHLLSDASTIHINLDAIDNSLCLPHGLENT